MAGAPGQDGGEQDCNEGAEEVLIQRDLNVPACAREIKRACVRLCVCNCERVRTREYRLVLGCFASSSRGSLALRRG